MGLEDSSSFIKPTALKNKTKQNKKINCINCMIKDKEIDFSYHVKNERTIQEKAIAPHSSTLAWKIPWAEEPVRLQSWGC